MLIPGGAGGESRTRSVETQSGGRLCRSFGGMYEATEIRSAFVVGTFISVLPRAGDGAVRVLRRAVRPESATERRDGERHYQAGRRRHTAPQRHRQPRAAQALDRDGRERRLRISERPAGDIYDPGAHGRLPRPDATGEGDGRWLGDARLPTAPRGT